MKFNFVLRQLFNDILDTSKYVKIASIPVDDAIMIHIILSTILFTQNKT